MADIENLTDLFMLKLRRMYDAERRLAKALPDLHEAASSADLKAAFQAHLEETEAHVDRLERIFELFHEKPDADTSHIIKGAIKDGEEAAKLDAEPAVRDAALIAAVQDTEHIEIASYGTLRTWAVVLQKVEAVHALEWTLEEEKAVDKRLTEIAETLNFRAAAAQKAD
jgi:ferritin-like metal-binding protein YciE